MTNEKRAERRRYPRVCPKGSTIVHAGTYILRGRVLNVSRGGVLVRTKITPPDRFTDSHAELDLRFDGGGAEWHRVGARITRIRSRAIALAFDSITPEFSTLIDGVASASYHHDRVMSIVLVDATEQRRDYIAEAFRAAGCTVVAVSTPLEAIVRLGESDFEPDLIAIADSSPGLISEEVRRFVDEEHPRAKLVTINDNIAAPEGIVHWLSSADPGGDLAARVRTVLTSRH